MNVSVDKITFSDHKKKTYQSPWAALLWSIAIPGFGQFYNRDYFLGLLLIGWEVLVNLQANVNESILYSFNGELYKAYEVSDLSWGLFYPAVFCYSIWQAFNKALKMNVENSVEGENILLRPHLTGFFFGMTIGMDFGLIWSFFISPVFSGLSLGLILGYIGHQIEKGILRKKGIEDERINRI
ncbi:hypothetical protein RZN25_15455 [Bacillaceae bacterium S4-13-56]